MADDRPESAELVYLEHTARERRFPIDGDLVTIGRVEGNDIRIPDVTVSRFHAKIRRRDDGFYVEDHASAGGTSVNGERIVDRRLVGGDVIHVGRVLLRFVTGSGGTETA